jgi:hypothetical protein
MRGILCSEPKLPANLGRERLPWLALAALNALLANIAKAEEWH